MMRVVKLSAPPHCAVAVGGDGSGVLIHPWVAEGQ